MSVTAAYLPQGEHREPSQYTPELSRRARGVEIWAALRSLGRAGLAEIDRAQLPLARRFADGPAAAGFEILNDVVLNQVLVSFGTPHRRRRGDRRVQAGRHLLVRPDGMAGPHRHAHQRLIVGTTRRGRGPQPGGDSAGGRG